MITIKRVNSKNPDFIALVTQLDVYLTEVDGDEHDFYHQFNSIDTLQHVIVFYMDDDIPVGCGAIKEFDSTTVEIKRMYVAPESRGLGLGSKILKELESWAAELNYASCILETGKRQVEAIALYAKNGYQVVPNYGQYQGVENSSCFQKNVSS